MAFQASVLLMLYPIHHKLRAHGPQGKVGGLYFRQRSVGETHPLHHRD